MAIIFIAGQGGIDGDPDDPIFNQPTPLLPLMAHVGEIGLSRTDIMAFDDDPAMARILPDHAEPTTFVAHSKGAPAAIAIAGVMPKLAFQNNVILSSINLILIDGVDGANWWNPWRPRFEIPACVKYCWAWVRDAMMFPYSSMIAGEDGNLKRNIHLPSESHVSIVAAAEPDVIGLLKTIYAVTQ